MYLCVGRYAKKENNKFNVPDICGRDKVNSSQFLFNMWVKRDSFLIKYVKSILRLFVFNPLLPGKRLYIDRIVCNI